MTSSNADYLPKTPSSNRVTLQVRSSNTWIFRKSKSVPSSRYKEFRPALSSVQSLSRVRLFATPWATACQASLSITNSQSLPKLMSTELVMSSNHLILCHPLLLLPSNPSQHQGLFKSVSSSHQVAKVLEFQFQHQSIQWTPRTDLL